MKDPVADPRKYVAGWCIVVLALATSIVGLVRESGGALGGGIFVAIFALGFVAEAKKKKEVTPHIPGLRWYHVAGVTLIVSTMVFWLWRSVLR